MPLHRPEFMVGVKKRHHSLPIRKIIVDTKTGNTENPPSQLPYLPIKMPWLRCMDQKVKLHPAPVQMTVQIHNAALRAAKLGISQHMKYPNPFPHFLSY